MSLPTMGPVRRLTWYLLTIGFTVLEHLESTRCGYLVQIQLIFRRIAIYLNIQMQLIFHPIPVDLIVSKSG